MNQTLISYLFGAALACAGAQAAEKPNIVHVVADDLGWRSCHLQLVCRWRLDPAAHADR